MFASSATRPLALAAGDRLQRTWVLFPTGLGKSALLANLIVQDAIRRSPHEALSLLIDPYRLCIEAPEGINLMLVQAVCEKISGRQKEPCLHKDFMPLTWRPRMDETWGCAAR